MIRGLYAAGSGMLAESIRSDVIANNLANAATTGYKKDTAVTKDFRSMLIRRINDGPDSPAIGSLGAGTVVDEVATSQTAGAMRTTGNVLDLAIDGRGFFAVETPDGVRYTRNGSFSLNGQGELVTQEGYRVIGTGGPISLADAKKITISEDGRVMMSADDKGGTSETETGKLQITSFTDERKLVKEGATLFRVSSGAEEEQTNALVRSGVLEQANVNVVTEMVNMISGYRAYEINSKMVQAHDELLDKAVNSIASV